MTPNTFTPSTLKQSTLQAFEVVTEQHARIQAGRDKLASLRQRESTLRALLADREAKATALRREHDGAEQAAREAAQALGRIEAAAELGEASADAVRLARDEWAARRKVAEKLRPRLDDAMQADAAAAMASERIVEMQPQLADALADIRAGSAILLRAWIDEALDAYDAAAAEVTRKLSRVHALAGIVASVRRHDLFILAPNTVTLPPLEAGRKPALSESEIAAIVGEQRGAVASLMHESGVELAPGAADPWSIAH